MSEKNHDMKLDEEWVGLISEAKEIGLTPEEVHTFLLVEQEKK
ncbi:anti-repressor SinI family protein [Alteribacillus sp. JSM 102045]